MDSSLQYSFHYVNQGRVEFALGKTVSACHFAIRFVETAVKKIDISQWQRLVQFTIQIRKDILQFQDIISDVG